ncbi:uncharacterized protein LOC136090831 [Hydra vulgaris]|uniref:Uncharacterized protein LOC136090831 n=1 Tax=Hydra vulgaris TaxID=6087 RepID=A0ABM4DHC3_HYDVU
MGYFCLFCESILVSLETHTSDPYLDYESINISPVESNGELIDQQGNYTSAHINKGNIHNVCSSALNVEKIKEMIIDVLMTLRCRNTSEVVIQYVGKSIQNILSTVIESVQKTMHNEETVASRVNDVLNDIECECVKCSLITSTYLQRKQLQQKGMVVPIEITVGFRSEMRHKISRSNVISYVHENMQYIPILETISMVISKHTVDKIDNNIYKKLNKLTCYGDAEQYKNHPFYQKHPDALQLQLYCDDFETVNPLGSKTKVHKVCAIYFFIKNVNTKRCSKLANIYPVIYCLAADVAKYGYEKLSKPLIKDLVALEKRVQLHINESYDCIYGAVVMWSGDNLALHQIFGFSSNFNANKSCHYCYTTKEQMQHTFYEEDLDLKTKEHHIADCQALFGDADSNKLSGVYKQNPLSELQYFSVPENICPDSMHVILKGCLQPLPITREKLVSKDKRLGINATQSWCLGRFFCLLLGDVVETDNQYCHLIHLLMEICGIIFVPKLTVHLITYLTEMISVHHNLFTEIISGHTVIPKQHFLIHYPTKMLQLGPSPSYWCMRFEGKHAPAKEQCHILHNFKNVCKSIAWRQQLQLHLHLSNFASILSIEVGPGFEIMPACLPLPISVFSEIPLYEEWFCANYVIKDGVKYMPDYIVVLGITKLCLPRFGKILYLLVRENECILIVKIYFTKHYDAHIAGYNVCKTILSKYKVVKIDNLFDSHVLSLSTGFRKYSNESFVITRHEYINLDILQ